MHYFPWKLELVSNVLGMIVEGSTGREVAKDCCGSSGWCPVGVSKSCKPALDLIMAQLLPTFWRCLKAKFSLH